jgi:hypothetical protein
LVRSLKENEKIKKYQSEQFKNISIKKPQNYNFALKAILHQRCGEEIL